MSQTAPSVRFKNSRTVGTVHYILHYILHYIESNPCVKHVNRS